MRNASSVTDCGLRAGCLLPDTHRALPSPSISWQLWYRAIFRTGDRLFHGLKEIYCLASVATRHKLQLPISLNCFHLCILPARKSIRR
uniref:Uncharacterized protein n=1 Tax=Physcomitrium patens TaxID=3218 RepID=A0A2K1J414_PHYPA|nr:hypothetical protein PHYPA_022114 [Physcomitrium patens]